MRVKCINDHGIRNFTKINKIHEVISETEKYYTLKISNLDYSLFKNRFKVMYTSEEIKKDKFAVEIDNEQDWIKFKKEFNNTCSKYYGHKIYFPNNGWNNLMDTYYKRNDYTVITFDQIEFMEKFVLPNTWHVIVTKENIDILCKWISIDSLTIGYIVGMVFNGKSFNKEHNNSTVCTGYDFGKEITTEQFKKYVLKENNMEKIVVGYKLIKLEYEKAALKIADHIGTFWIKNLIDKGYCFGYNSVAANKLKEAGVLDLWFKKVYENEYFKKGNWITIVNLVNKSDINNVLNKSFEIKEVQEKGFKGNEDVRYVIKHESEGIYHKCVRLATEEEIKASQVIKVQMTSTSGDFEIEVSKNKIYYKPDNKELSLNYVIYIIKTFINYDSDFTTFPYKIITDTVTVGCKSGTTLECWKKVLEAYNSFQ